MGSRTSLMLLAAASIGIALWLVAQGSERSGGPPTLKEAPTEAADTGKTEPGPLLKGGDREATAQPPPDPQPANAEGEGEGDILYTGQVVDTSDTPVAGATVTAKWRGEILREVTTDEKGTYRFRASFDVDDSTFLTGVVVARGPEGAVGYGWFVIAQPTTRRAPKLPSERSIYKLVLRPGVSLDIAVSATCEAGLPATVWVVGAGFGATEPIAMDHTDASGRLTLEGLPSGPWRLVAAAAGCGRDTVLAQLPQPERKTLELSIPEARSLTVRVREKENEKPIPGARVAVEEYVRLPNMHGRGPLVSVPSEYVTDEHGVAVIDGLGTKERLTLFASAKGFPGVHGTFRRGGQGRVSVEPDEAEVTIELQRPRNVRWPIEDKGHGVPPDGSVVVLKPFLNSGLTDIPQGGVVENSEIVVAGWAPGYAAALAYVEGFGAARLSAGPGEAVGYPAAFYPLRKIELYARLADGSPAEGVYLMARDGGNNAVAPGAKTDAAGYAVLAGLHGGPGARVNCTVTRTAQEYGGLPLGSVDLHKQDGHFEFTLPNERTLRVTIILDGKPPPAGFTAYGQVGAQPVALKPDVDGVCEIPFTPAKPTGDVFLYLRLTGYLASAPAKASLAGPDPIEMAVDLVTAGSALIKVLVPKDGRNKITTQAWDADKGEWIGHVAPNSFNVSMGGGTADPNGLVTLPNLRPGRYRAVDTYSGITGEPFDVVAGGEPTRSTLDLTKSGWVKGRVVPPPGVPVGEFTVAAEGEAPNTSFRMFGTSGGLPGRPVNGKDGTFWYRVPGDRPVTLRIYHTTCVPHPTKGRVTVTGPREGIELHAEAGASATVHLAEPLRMYMNPGQKRSVQVRLYKGAVKGAGIGLTGTLDGAAERIEFGGFAPGTYTLWIDTLSAAPLVLEDVVLGEGDADLGTHATSKGSTFLLHVKVKEGQSPSRVHLTARRAGEPAYARHTDAIGTTIVLSGLGPGRFRIQGGFYAGTGGGFDEEITFDGKNDVERTIDLR